MQVFLYQGEFECYQFPFVLVPVIGAIMLVIFGGVLPLYVLKLIYAPGVSVLLVAYGFVLKVTKNNSRIPEY